MLISYYR